VRDRRILKPRRPLGPGITELELVEEAFPAPEPGELAVQVVAALLDPRSLSASANAALPEAPFAGVISEVAAGASEQPGVGRTVIGIGPLADRLSVPTREVRTLPADSHLSPQQAATLPYLCSFLDALRGLRIEPQDRVLITGQAAIQHVSRQLLRALYPQASATRIASPLGEDIGTQPDGPFDVLVHGVADALDLQLSLSALAEDGRAFLLVPPGRHVLPLDFYPDVHRSCLRLVARRVGSPCRPASCPDPGHPLLSALLEQRSLDLDPILSPVSSSSDLAGLPLEPVIRS
jgi:hypothetical protein